MLFTVFWNLRSVFYVPFKRVFAWLAHAGEVYLILFVGQKLPFEYGSGPVSKISDSLGVTVLFFGVMCSAARSIAIDATEECGCNVLVVWSVCAVAGPPQIEGGQPRGPENEMREPGRGHSGLNLSVL